MTAGFHFWANAVDIRLAWLRTTHQAAGMETDDDLFLDLVESVTRDVLDRIGNDPEARYAFFRRFLELAKEEVGRKPGRSLATPKSARWKLS